MVAFEYDAATGLLTKEIVEPDTTQLRLESAHTYNAFGNRTATTVSSPATGQAAIQSRTSGAGYDTRGRFPTSVTNPLNQSETRQYDVWFNELMSLTGPNALTTQWLYDDLGLKWRELRADNTKTVYSYMICTAPCPSSAAYYIKATPYASTDTTYTVQNAPWTKVYYDSLNREVRRETQGFDGGGTAPTIVQLTEYNALGRIARVSRPHISGGTVQWTQYTYDALGRPTQATRPDGSFTTYSYNGLVTTTRVHTDATHYQQSVATRNSRGETVSVVDDAGKVLASAYDPFGNLASVAVDADSSHTITLAYDARGRKTQMVDPDMGTWSYVYNAASEMVQQTDAKSQVTTLSHDKLGRLTQRAEPNLVSTWYYDTRKYGATCAKGIGKLCQTEADNGYNRIHSYDSLGRPSSTQTTVDSTTYTISVTYDSEGRLLRQVYPTNLAVRNAYTSLGYLRRLQNDAATVNYWQADSVDAEGRVLQYTLGNGIVTQQAFEAATGRLLSLNAGPGNGVQSTGYTYDWPGNLTARQDAAQSTVDAALYDNLNRLTSHQKTGSGGPVTVTFGYNDLGNLTSRSDVGTYTYPASGARPHAVTQVAGAVNTSFTYDANGNLTAGNGRSYTWTSFNLPAGITQGGQTTSFAYDSDHERVKSVAPSKTTYYFNPAAGEGLFYEKEVANGWQTSHRHYLNAGGVAIGAIVRDLYGTDTVQYWHNDHLGSVAVVTNSAGQVQQRCDYAAFGARSCTNGAPLATRGYTGHEHLDSLGLIHMNGRLFDAQIGRFVSADPIVQNPKDLQSYNRYSYVMNRPLNFTDPSGFAYAQTDYFQQNNQDLSDHALNQIASGPFNASPFHSLEIQRDIYHETDIGFVFGNPGFSGRTLSGDRQPVQVASAGTLGLIAVGGYLFYTAIVNSNNNRIEGKRGEADSNGIEQYIPGEIDTRMPGYSSSSPEGSLSILDFPADIANTIWNLIFNEEADNVPLPTILVGTQDELSRRQGNRYNNGPLDPAHGGSGDPRTDFDRLTGGRYAPAPVGSSYPSGTLIGDNGISFRPASGKNGPRIDIPANGGKINETLHY